MAMLTVQTDDWPLRAAFTISRGSRIHAETVTAELRDGDLVGRGECLPYPRYGETAGGVGAQIMAMAGAVGEGMDRAALQGAMPPGAARNALDCAFWDLEAKRAGKRVWELIGAPAPAPQTTAYTLSLDAPEAMRAAAAANAHRPLLKLKLAGPGDLARVEAVRAGAPAPRIIVDANEGWSPEIYADLAPRLIALGVEMIEQPLPADADAGLRDLDRPIPVCADESCHDRASLADILGKYDMINIKLDKTGGLTEALALRAAAEAEGLRVMVGCMVATSLSMAPAVLVAQGAQVVDLDGPLLLAEDRAHGLGYGGGMVHPPAAALWG